MSRHVLYWRRALCVAQPGSGDRQGISQRGSVARLRVVRGPV